MALLPRLCAEGWDVGLIVLEERGLLLAGLATRYEAGEVPIERITISVNRAEGQEGFYIRP